ncbi:hypothetical protein SH584_11530 [Sphingomonas sp. LY29]|uniref:hypothetical protein n=1 Tax=Sphingomonas sp. LY29 TaxID=3095341 RepID=UPI002D76ADB2|nr:hypothetical protein [Sphingomonas sp. LY29]WRP25662.1 hypothetical protein SH584_11530 [Sphingomonas sp. LY29]
MTALEIGLAVAIKGALVVFLAKKGWWPDWEERAYKREEAQRVFKAYEEWCEKTGKRPFEDPKIPERLKFTVRSQQRVA